ncbi:unnamed protein product [Caenorhabditis bovis]|uniref:Uncharacterized protein n=1 Tax=Caenorhabditis bovis TaxID=2654633 RepID=A0A8S1FDR4_9PELO|nr:unnamed protein product [Caenorhabditis bovis]
MQRTTHRLATTPSFRLRDWPLATKWAERCARGDETGPQCASLGCCSPQKVPAFTAEQERMLKSNQSNEPQSFITAKNKDAKSDMIDLEEVVTNWAKLIFDTTKSKSEAKIKKKYLSYNINWTKLFQECSEPIYTVLGAKPPAISSSKDEKVLFKTTFTNTTQREQEYSFKTERATRSSSTVIIEKGVCRGAEVSLKLKTPCEVVEANAGFTQEVMLNHIGENTNEEELSWGVDSTVRVPPNTEAVAELVIIEDVVTRDFRIENRLSGKVVVTITNMKENNCLVTVIEGNIADIIRGMPDFTAKGFRFDGPAVIYETRGQCIFRFGVEQKVHINEFPLNNSRRY